MCRRKPPIMAIATLIPKAYKPFSRAEVKFGPKAHKTIHPGIKNTSGSAKIKRGIKASDATTSKQQGIAASRRRSFSRSIRSI
jgi:hypothetical protein